MLPEFSIRVKLLFILIAGILFFPNQVKSQISWYSGSPGEATTDVGDIVICSDTLVSVFVQNNSGAPLINPRWTIDLSHDIDYVPGSMTETTFGSPFRNGMEFDITNLNIPKFKSDTLYPGQWISFQIKIKASCGADIFPTNTFIVLNYNDLGGNLQMAVPQILGIASNVNSAALNVVSLTNTPFLANLGTTFSQTARIRNAGLGYIDGENGLLFIRVLLDSTSCLEISNPTIVNPLGNVANCTISLNKDTVLIPLSAIRCIGDQDSLWENNEDMLISYNVKVTCCENLNRLLNAWWGCEGQACQFSTGFNSNVIINNAIPNLVASMPKPNYDYCFTGDSLIQRIRIVNTGAGPASNIRLGLDKHFPGSFDAFTAPDTSIPWIVYDSTGINVLGTITGMVSGASANMLNGPGCVSSGKTFANIVRKLPLDLTIPPGDTIYIDVLTRAYKFSCNPGCYDATGWLGFRSQLEYSNQCNSANYVEAFKALYSRAYSYVQPNFEMPTDLVDEQLFDIKVDYSNLYTYNHPSGRGNTMLVMPLFQSRFIPQATYVVPLFPYETDTLPLFVVNDTMYIRFKQNRSISGYKFSIPFKADCGINPCLGGGSITINFSHIVNYDTLASCAAPPISFGCRSRTTILHCPCPCPPGGATPVSFNLKRITYGLPDNNNNSTADTGGVLDLSKIADHHAINGDTLLATWNINVYPNTGPLNPAGPADPNAGTPFNYTYIDFYLGSGSGDLGLYGNEFDLRVLDTVGPAEVEIYPAGGGPVIICSVSPTIVGGGFYAKYHLDSFPCSDGLFGPTRFWSGGDRIVVRAKYKVNQSVNNGSGVNIFTTRNEVYSSYLPKYTPQTAAIPYQTYTCDHFNDYSEIYKIWMSPYIETEQKINGCSNVITSYMRQYMRNQEGPNMFPFEYRNMNIADSMFVLIPPGFDYRPNSAIFRIRRGYPAVDYTIDNVDVSKIGDTMIFSNLRKFYHQYGGVAWGGDELDENSIRFSLDPTCEAVAGVFNTSTYSVNIGNGVNTPLHHTSYTNSLYGNSKWAYHQYNDVIIGQPGGYVYNPPQPVLSGGGNLASIDDTAKWFITLQNLSNAISAPNSWLHLCPMSSDTLQNIVVMSNGSILPRDANGFYNLGNLNASGLLNIMVRGTRSGCDTIKYLAKSGWECSVLPTDINDPELCYQSVPLNVYSYPTGTDAKIDVLWNASNNTVNFCTEFEVELKINATQLGDVGGMKAQWLLPPGYVPDIPGITVKFPKDAGGFITPTDLSKVVLVGSTLYMQIDSLHAPWNYQLTGSYDSLKKEISIRVPFSTECGSFSGDQIEVLYNAKDRCDLPLERIELRTPPIVFAEATVPAYSTAPRVIEDTIQSCMSSTLHTMQYRIRVSRLTGLTMSGDSIYIIFPTGVIPGTYLPGTVPPANGPAGPVPVAEGLRYSFDMPAGFGDAPDTLIDFAFTYQIDEDFGGGCETPFEFRIFTAVNIAVVCNGNQCNISNITGADDGTVLRVDSIPPNPDFIPVSDTVYCASDIPPIANLTGTDQCPGTVTLMVTSTNDSTCPNQMLITREYRLSDSCGNDTNIIQTILVVDTIAPDITECLLDTMVVCVDSIPLPDPSRIIGVDACGGVVVPSFARDSIYAQSCGDKFKIKRWYYLQDACNNRDSCFQIITINDTVKPLIACPTAITVYENDACIIDTSTTNTGSATATDNCTNVVTNIGYIDVKVNGSCPYNYTINRSWTATDSCGNTSLPCIQVITILDTVKPVITCPAPRTVYENAVCVIDTATSNTGIATATDNCNKVVTRFVYNDVKVNGSCPYNYTINRTWTATDSCGNTSLPCIQLITILDTVKPVITCPAPRTVYENATCAIDTATSNTGVATATDNCNKVVTRFVYNDVKLNGACPYNYTINRTWTATDSCGNTSLPCIQVITILDTIKPVITCPTPITMYENTTCAIDTATSNTGVGTATDNCNKGVTRFVYNDIKVNGSCPYNYTINRTWTAIDSCGNTSLPCLQVITILDTVTPVITCPAPITVYENAACAIDTATSNTGTATATDNCNKVVTRFVYNDVKVNGSCPYNYTINRTWTATDSCGNTSLPCIQVITILDTIKPVITCPAPITVYENAACAIDTATSNTGVATATDNCNKVVTRFVYNDVKVNGACPYNYTINRTWTATDSCGNTSLPCIQVITIVDTIRPMILCPKDTTVDCEAAKDSIALGTASATDNCSKVVTKIFKADQIDQGECPGYYTITRVWTAMDSCGNSRSCTQLIFVQDTTNPIIECPDTLVNTECMLPAPLTYTGFLASGGSITDNCYTIDTSSFGLSIADDTTSMSSSLVVIKRTYTISDSCKNTSTCEQIILVYCDADIALKKQLAAGQELFSKGGDIVHFNIKVFNQSEFPLDSIKLIDYFGIDFTLHDATWTDNLNGSACINLTRKNGKLPSGGLKTGDSIEVPIELKIVQPMDKEFIINKSEVVSFRDTFGNSLVDVDSKPDDILGNDPGGQPNTPDDDKIDGDSKLGEDEDDEDPVLLYICRPLVCVGKVNISLDENCEHCLKPKDFIKGYPLPDEFYKIEIIGPDGKNKESCLGRKELGYTLVYKIKQLKCNPSECWGYLTVEDKLAAVGLERNDTITCFELATLPSEPFTVNDNCDGESKVFISKEIFEDYGCDSQYLSGRIKRVLIATDKWGNNSEFEQIIAIQKISLDSILCPRDTVIDCSLDVITIKDVKVSIKDPLRSGFPKVKTKNGIVSLWPNNAACKLTVSPPKDEQYPICGAGYKILRTWRVTDWCTGEEKECRQWIEVIDQTAPIASNKTLPIVYADPHSCGQYVDIDTIAVTNCSKVRQNFAITYTEEGQVRVINGVLPVKRLWLPVGIDTVRVLLVDECRNHSTARIIIPVVDNTPPTPVCDEFTQVTVDPLTCWSAIAAKDLDNGSHDNCVDKLHFAAAHMDSVTYWRNYWTQTLETKCGKAEFWNNKAFYDIWIEGWIDCYVFADTVHFDECGSNRVILRVYEANKILKLDVHSFPWSVHAWYCYNSSRTYRLAHNYNYFHKDGAKSKSWRLPLNCEANLGWLNENSSLSQYSGGNNTATLEYLTEKRIKGWLYNDCMVNVLVDDKQAPVAYGLEDITVYCDGAPDWAPYSYCGNDPDNYTSSTWPGELKDKKGVIHGYYGGTAALNLPGHKNLPGLSADDHSETWQVCDQSGWAPIYCRDWLYLDSFDNPGKVDPKTYFDKLVMFDKKTKQTAELKENEFSITDNCLLDKASLKVTDAGTINGCGEGWISRTWTVKDKCGNEVTATQKIYVKHRSDFEVIFPADKTVTCDFLNRTDTSALGAGKPIISDDECEQVGVKYVDQIFEVEDSACYKIVRTWTMIDWCIYDPNQHNHQPDVIVNDSLRANSSDRSCVYRNIKDNGDGYMKYVQIIKVIDEISPSFTCTDNTTCITTGCDVNVNLPLSATDNCTDASDIRFRAEITKPDGSVERRSDITAITGKFTEGVYSIKLWAKDKCGNETTCTMTLTIKDCKKPTPYCIDGLATVIMPSTGTVEIWAKDFNVASEDNCTTKDKLRYSFGNDVTKANRVITCADIPNGKESLITVEIYVHDLADNKDLCKVSLKLQDNSSAEFPSDACKDTTAALATITGKLSTEENEGVENARVEITSNATPAVQYMSKIDGSYSFKDMPVPAATGEMAGTNYSIKALRDDEPMNGVSTLDLVNIQKHILGTERLKSAYKMIAADVNNDKDITVVDLVELRKLVLGIYDKLPENTSWKFVPKSYVFADVNDPWSYTTQEAITELKAQMVKDFVGIKVGDVNASATPHSLMGTEVRSTETGLIFEVEDRVFKAGEKVKVEFRSPNFAGVSGFQGTLSTKYEERVGNPPTTPIGAGGKNGVQTLLFESISSEGQLQLSNNNIGLRYLNEGMVTMSWNTKSGIDIDKDQVLFTMTFTAQKDGKLSDVMRIGSQHTKAESYEGKGELGNLSIRFTKNGQEVSATNTLYQNYPNPFDQRTVIGINLAQSTQGVMKITDVTGRVIKSFDREWNKGYNEVWLDRREIKATGILFYTFESKNYTATKRMIIIE